MNEAGGEPCYHCGLPVPSSHPYRLHIDGRDRSFCCPGCLAVASAIVDGGLSGFYRFRTESGVRPSSQGEAYEVYDLQDVQQEFVHQEPDGSASADLLLEGITCAACVWLIERYMRALPGLVSISVNATTHRCRLTWNGNEVMLSELMAALADIGYRPVPATAGRQQAVRERENRRALMRLAVAGFGMMQVGMVAIALYAGAEAEWQRFFRWLSLLIATPVVLFSAAPFFTAALRALKTRHLVMDVPVSLAIGGAYLASIWATVTATGEVYFDSVSMFTFFLLVGRYLEMRVRHRNGIDTDKYAQMLPTTVQRRAQNGDWETILLKQLVTGDQVMVPSGSCIPCDGEVTEGCSGVVETLITGEPDAVEKGPGDAVIAGTMNTDNVLFVSVTAVGQDTRLSAIERLVEQALQEKPQQVAAADRIASWFVGVLLIVATAVSLAWWQIDSSKAFWITLSLLVVTCPCALSLASPTALTVAVSRLRRQGLLVTRGHVLEGLTRVDRVLFDKTGTLTEGRPIVAELRTPDGVKTEVDSAAAELAIAASLERGSSHPIARAFAVYDADKPVRKMAQSIGRGVSGEVELEGEWCSFRLGRADFADPQFKAAIPGDGQWLLLSEGEGESWRPRLWIRLQDQLRASALEMVESLRRRGLAIELISGDCDSEVSRVAGLVNPDSYRSQCSPDDKLAYLKALQKRGERVMMIGDGINDVPVLSGAFISVAMGDASDLAQTRADSVLLNGDLRVLSEAFECAGKTRQIIRQNLGWALTYNLLAVPLAAMGWVPPWAAAIGMSSSSLVVVCNALRIDR